MREYIFHIGDYKTGTSWLQEIGLPTLGIQYLGDPVQKNLDILLRYIADTPDIAYDEYRARMLMERVKFPSGLDSVVISREALSYCDFINGTGFGRTLNRLKSVFKNIKVVFVTRSQGEMIVSMYSQYIKRGGNLSLKEFVFDPYTSPYIVARLDYVRSIAIIKGIIDEENLLIDTYENFKNLKTEFLTRLCEFIGVDREHMLREAAKPAINKSLGRQGAALMKFFNNFTRGPHSHQKCWFDLSSLVYLFLSKRRKILLIRKSRINNYGRCNKYNKRHRILQQIDWTIHNNLADILTRLPFQTPLKLDSETNDYILSKYER